MSNYVFCFENYHKFWIITKYVNYFNFCFLYHKLQFCFIYPIHYTLVKCSKRFLKFWDFETLFEYLKTSNSITFCSCECFLSVSNNSLPPKKLIIKRFLFCKLRGLFNFQNYLKLHLPNFNGLLFYTNS